MGTRLTIHTPGDYVLSRDVCSYGYFILAPNHWDVERQTLRRAFDLADGPASGVLSQPGDAGSPIIALFDRALARAEQGEARRQVVRMLRLTESEADIRAFHRVDRRWKRSGRGRLFRSPTLFEDVLKTVTSCNVSWPSTVGMNARLCAVVGRGGAFPTPRRVARTRPGTLRGRCRVGYRDARIIALAKLFASGQIDEAWLDDRGVPDDEVFAFLKTLPGIGPYAAGNIMQLLGRYSRLAVDTESVRHGKTVLGMTGEDRDIVRALETHYERFGEHRFRSYWFEVWRWYESKRGVSHSWDRETTGKTFTAAQFANA